MAAAAPDNSAQRIKPCLFFRGACGRVAGASVRSNDLSAQAETIRRQGRSVQLGLHSERPAYRPLRSPSPSARASKCTRPNRAEAEEPTLLLRPPRLWPARSNLNKFLQLARLEPFISVERERSVRGAVRARKACEARRPREIIALQRPPGEGGDGLSRQGWSLPPPVDPR